MFAALLAQTRGGFCGTAEPLSLRILTLGTFASAVIASSKVRGCSDTSLLLLHSGMLQPYNLLNAPLDTGEISGRKAPKLSCNVRANDSCYHAFCFRGLHQTSSLPILKVTVTEVFPLGL